MYIAYTLLMYYTSLFA